MTTLKFADTHKMVAFLSKPTESDRFEQNVEFFECTPVKYAINRYPTIYTSCIEQFWSTVMVKTINGESQLHALVDGKKIIITKLYVRRDLQLANENGIDCLPNSTIFKQLALMGGGPKCQETIGDTTAPTRFKSVSKHSNDSLLARGNTLQSDEDRLKLDEMVRKCLLQNKKLLLIKNDEVNVVEDVSAAGNVVSTAGDATTVSAVTNILAKIDADHKLAERMQTQEQEELSIEEKTTLFQQLLEKRRKHFAAKRVEEKRNKPPTKAQQRQIMCTYLKNMEGYKLKDLKNKQFDSIQEMFDRAFKRVNTFEDFREQNEEEEAIDAIPFAVKSLIKCLKVLIGKILEELSKLVKAKYESTRPVEDEDLLLWGNLKTMFEPHVEDAVWRNQQAYKVLDLKLYDSFYIHKHKDYLGKFDEKADDGYFLGYSLVSKAFRVFNTRKQQTEETYHITFDESTHAIKFSKPLVDNINIFETERYPPDEYIHHYEPSQQYQVNSNEVSFIDPYERPDLVVLETEATLIQ
ncbi:hypothetical protein Tco_1555507 [Tanacetum coccineum]